MARCEHWPMVMSTRYTVPVFSQARLDRQLQHSTAHAVARLQVAAEWGLDAYCRKVKAEAHRRVRAALATR